MATINCEACEDIRQTDPNLIVNGFSDTECASLKNDTGLNPSSGHNDCTDLDNLNDCLIGNMENEVDAYEVCDWKTFMKNFIPNVWTTIKGIICAICGIWTHIHDIRCEISYLYNGASFSFGEEATSSRQSVLVAGTGVDFGIRSASQEHTYDITIWYIAGGLGRLFGSLRLFTESFKDVKGNTKSGNSVWNFSSNNFTLPRGGELLYEIRIKESEFPQIKSMFDGNAFYSGGGNKFLHAWIYSFTAGSYAYGQHGWCNTDGTPTESGYSSGHKVPSGWRYIQVRLHYQDGLETYGVKDGSGNTKQGTDLSLGGYIGMRMNKDKIDC